MINFIGIGAQKSGTSWVYACLYEHPEICAPVKEIHFFSRPRFKKGGNWYEKQFSRCAEDKKLGEFSTSYLYSDEAAMRIKALYPETKLIAILRNPKDRAFSQYCNAIKAGEISDSISFKQYVSDEPSAYEQGLYMEQLERYYSLFPKEQILVLIYEDIKKDPANFIKKIYTFLEVDAVFSPSMLYSQVNVARTPKFVFVERIMHFFAEVLRKFGFDRLVWVVRKSGVTEMVRNLNTKSKKGVEYSDSDLSDTIKLALQKDVQILSKVLDRDLCSEWNI